ncbi:MAG: TIGR02099 family protein [Acidobacteria bacterium RIFCSPLOWO2_12_FULL_67_14b]|nr:MAG: TIGR02099 family protein [Acidobacteria bacterium RIFCSPLOWO2_12_FULL_67_14b]
MQTKNRILLNKARPWLRALEVLAWAGFFAFAALFLAMRYWLLPNVERYREDIVAAISRSVGLKVTIGRIEADWEGLRPELVLSEVRVFDRDGREALVLPTVENVVSWRSLLYRDLRLHSLAIEGPRLQLRRDAQGAIWVAGMRVEEDKGDRGLADWILGQREIEVRNAEIDWNDEMRKAPPLALAALNFRLRNDGDEHSIGLSARPPSKLGSALELRAELIGRTVKELKAWNGRVFAELGYTDLAGWRAWVDYPVDVRKGQGAVRLWATLGEGKVRRATADVSLTGVVARFAKDLPVLDVPAVRGRLEGRETARGYEFGVRNLAVVSGRGPAMQSTSFRAHWERAESGKPQRGLINADLIELGPLAHLAEFMPFPADLRKLLAELAPQGNLLDLKFDWSGELPDAATFSAKTRFAGLAMKAWRAIPGFGGLSGNVEANEAKGTMRLASLKSELDLPKVFPEPRIALDALNGEIHWERQAGGGVAVRIASLAYANEDLAGTAQGSYRYTGEGPGRIDLSAQLARADGRHSARYLPLSSIMGAATREWLAASIQGGQSTDVRFRLQGDLRDFPYVDPAKGQFLVTAKISGGVLEYARGWPRIEAIEGELLFERDRMEIAGRAGGILGAKIANTRVGIPSLLSDRTMLLVSGQAEGPTAEFLKYIQESPVRAMIDGFSDGMTADGRGRLQLKLELPIDDLAKSKVAGEYRFANNTVTLEPRLPPVEHASGRIAFTESTLAVHETRGQLFGGPVTITGGSRPASGVDVVAEGSATVEGIRTLFDHPLLGRLSGGAPYRATVTVRDKRAQIAFESSLRGVASELPAPFAKSAAETLPLRVDIYPGEGRDRISLALGRLVAAEFLRVLQGGEMRVQRAAVSINPAQGEALRLPERRAIALYGSLPALDLDRWLPLLAGDGSAGAAGFDLRLGTLDFLGKRMKNVVLRGAADAEGWTANVTASELAGNFAYRGEGGGRLIARLSHFAVPDDYPEAKPAEGIKELPAVDLVAESFTHRGKRYGRVEVVARHDGPSWRIDKLAVVNPEASLSASGAWRTAGGSRTSLNFTLESSDVGKFLERAGYPDRVQGGSARLEGGLAWNGDPLSIDLPSLSGELALTAEKGQFPQVETGLGRLFSLISLQLSDVFAKGFQFDTLSASFRVAQGVMDTKDLKIRGSAAEVALSGDFDLARETQSLHVKVVPSVRRTVTTLIGIVNPAVAVGVAVAQGVLKDPIGRILAYEYTVSGPWKDPKLEKIDQAPPPTPSGAMAPVPNQ